MYVFINEFLQQATWLKGQIPTAFSPLGGGQVAHTRKKNPHGIFAARGALMPTQEKKKKKTVSVIFAVGRALVSTQEGKTICALVERIYLIIVSKEGNLARFALLSKILESFNVMGCIPPSLFMGMQRKV